MEKDELRPCPQDKYHQHPLIYEDETGNIFGHWRLALSYVDWLDNPAGLEEFKKELLSRGITQQEIDDALAFSRQFNKKD